MSLNGASHSRGRSPSPSFSEAGLRSIAETGNNHTTRPNDLSFSHLTDNLLDNRVDTLTLHPYDVSIYHRSSAVSNASFEACTGDELVLQDFLTTCTEDFPCGHPTTFSEVDVSRSRVISTCGNIYSYLVTPLVATDKGYEMSDPCFCSNQAFDCRECMYLQILRTDPAVWNRIYGEHVCFTSLTDFLTKERGFRCEGYNVECEDGDGFEDTEEYTILCVQYTGPYKQRRQWHVLTRDDECNFCKYRVSTGLFVPEIPHRWEASYGRKQVLTLPTVSGQAVDFLEQPTPPSLQWMALSRLIESKRILPSLFRNISTLTRYSVEDSSFLPYLYRDPFFDNDSDDEFFDSIHPSIGSSPCNFQQAATLVACADDRDGPEIRDTIIQNQQHNVDLAETTEPSTSHVANVQFGVLPYFYDECHTYPDLTERWARFTDFQWTTSQLAGAILFRYDLPFDAITQMQNTPNALPWRQHAFFRSDMEIMLQINSQPAQSGYIVMGTMYNASELTGSSTRVTDVAHVLQMPNIKVAAGASNSGVLRVPWMRHFPIAPTLDSNWDYPMYFHTIFIAVLAPLRTGADGPIAADCVLQVRFPNLEFYGMRNTVEVVAPTILQASAWERDLTEEGIESNPGPFFGSILGGIGTALSMVSGIASTVSSIAGSIGSFGSKAKSVVDSTEGLLRKVYPKDDMDRPQNIREPHNMYLQQNTSLALATGVNTLKLLQLQAENTVTHPPAFVPNDDQFSTPYITEVFGQIALVQWSTTQARGDTLFSWPVTPLNGKTLVSTISTAARFVPTPMGAVSSYYSGYHGNMLMRLTFALSKFHSGRVYIVYSPDQFPNQANVGALYATLLDVQDQSQYTFVVPYQVPSTFAPIYASPRGFTVADSNTIPLVLPHYGFVTIYVENQLKVMETASPTIDIVVEMAGAPDFALQLPCGSPLRNLDSVPPAALLVATGGEGEPVEAEVDQSDERTKVMDASTPLRHTFPAWALNLNETYDIRDVVKRYVTWFSLATPQVAPPIYLQFCQVSVYHSPLSSIDSLSPILNPVWTSTAANDVDFILGSSHLIACERVNFNTNSTISFRIPWTTNASVLSNGIDPQVRFNQLPAYCNGRVHVILELGSSVIYSCSWDVTLGSAAQRVVGFRPDLITTLHDAFRFSKSDFNYQLDFTISPSATFDLASVKMRVRRAMGDGGNFYIFQGFPSYNNVVVASVNLIGGESSPSGIQGIDQFKTGQLKTFSTPRAFITRTGMVIRPAPVRDLTQDGDVESNPGPFSDDEPGPSRPDPDTEYFSSEEQEYLGRAGVFGSVYRKVTSYLNTVKGMPREAVNEFWARYDAKRKVVVDFATSVRTVSDFVKTVDGDKIDKKQFERAFEAFEHIGKASDNFNHVYDRVTSDGGVSLSVSALEGSLKYSTFIINIWQSNSIYQTLLNVSALLSEMGLCRIVASHVMEYFSVTATADGDDEDELSTGWTSLVITAILGTLGASAVVLKGSNVYEGLLKETKEYFRTGFNVKKFLDSHFKCIKQLWQWIKIKIFGGQEAPSTDGLSEDLVVWMEKVHTLTEVYNFEHLLSDPVFARRVLDLQEECGKFDIQFAISKRPAPAMYSVNKGRLQRAVDALGKQGGLRRNRCTPFCVWIYGASGAGKSHMSDEILINVGDVLGVRSNDPIYYRSLDVEYWNGYNQQKLIAYQDFAKITTGEDFRRHVSELSSLIEPYPVNPPFAELEDKKRIADAVGVLVTSNHAFPPIQNIGMTIDSLFFRRRHVLLHIRFRDSVIKAYKDKGIELTALSGNQVVYYPNLITDSDRERLGEYFYLEFGFHNSGIDRTEPILYVSYEEMLERIRDEALIHRSKEMKGLQRKEGLYERLKPEHEVTGKEFKERIFTATGKETKFPNAVDIELLGMEFVPAADATSGRLQVVVEASGSSECDCREELEGRVFKKIYCVRHFPGGDHQVINEDVLEANVVSGDPVVAPPFRIFGTEGRLPTDPSGIDRHVINWFNRKFERKLPEGYRYWHEVSSSCCHDPDILRRAYFENVDGKVEVVLDYSLSDYEIAKRAYAPIPRMFEDECDIPKQRRVVLTPVCPVSIYNHFLRMVDGRTGVTYNFNQSDGAPIIGKGMFKKIWKCKCELTKPFKGFLVSDGVVRMKTRGTLYDLKDVSAQAAALNQCLGLEGTTAEEVFGTYFAYEHETSTRWKHYSRQALSGLMDVVTALKLLLGAGLCMYGIYKIYKAITAMFAMQATASQSGDIRRTEKTRNPALRFSPAKAAPVVLTASGEEKMIALSNSFVRVSKGRLNMWGIRICHDFIMVPYHLLVAKGDLEVQVLMSGVFGPPIRYADSELIVAQLFGDKDPLDVAMVKVVGMPAAKNIVNYFCKEMEAPALKAEACWIKPVGERVAWGDTNIQPYYCTNVSYSNPGMERMRTELLGFKMRNNNNPHKCGTMLMSNDVICGMIVAATTLSGESFAISVSREMVVEGLRALGATPFDMKMKTTPVEVVEGVPMMMPPDEGDFVLVGKAVKGVTYAGKTQLQPSIIHGELSEPFRFPAAQKLEATGERTGFDVVMNGCKRQFNKPLTIDPKEVRSIRDYLVERIVPNSVPVRVIDDKPVSIQTAVLGVPTSTFNPMKLNTAIGWPLMTRFPKGYKKKDIIKISDERTEVKIHKYAMEEYLEANEGRRRGVLANTVFMDFPKDELLKVGKATRLINGAPLHHTLDMKRYLGEFLESIVRLDNKIAVGIDVHSTDWVEVHSGNDDVVNEDYKNFGPGFHSQWLEVIADVAVAWVHRFKTNDPEYESVVRCLLREVQSASHIAGDLIFQVLCGSPSGAFGTDRINSLANLCYHCLCYLRKYSTLIGFWEHYLLVYGDDTRRVDTAYSFEEFNACMRSIGITVELDKGGNTFLKREFKPYIYNGVSILLAPLPLPIVGDIVNWVRKPIFDQVSALEQSVDSYLSEMFHHGQDRFEAARSQIQEIFGRYGRNPELKDFNTTWCEKYGSSGSLPVGRYVNERGEILKHDITTMFVG